MRLFIFSFNYTSIHIYVIQLFVATSPKTEGVTGKYYEPIGKITTPSALALNETLQQQLWDYSEEAVKDFLSLTHTLEAEVETDSPPVTTSDTVLYEEEVGETEEGTEEEAVGSAADGDIKV